MSETFELTLSNARMLASLKEADAALDKTKAKALELGAATNFVGPPSPARKKDSGWQDDLKGYEKFLRSKQNLESIELKSEEQKRAKATGFLSSQKGQWAQDEAAYENHIRILNKKRKDQAQLAQYQPAVNQEWERARKEQTDFKQLQAYKPVRNQQYEKAIEESRQWQKNDLKLAKERTATLSTIGQIEATTAKHNDKIREDALKHNDKIREDALANATKYNKSYKAIKDQTNALEENRYRERSKAMAGGGFRSPAPLFTSEKITEGLTAEVTGQKYSGVAALRARNLKEIQDSLAAKGKTISGQSLDAITTGALAGTVSGIKETEAKVKTITPKLQAAQQASSAKIQSGIGMGGAPPSGGGIGGGGIGGGGKGGWLFPFEGTGGFDENKALAQQINVSDKVLTGHMTQKEALLRKEGGLVGAQRQLWGQETEDRVKKNVKAKGILTDEILSAERGVKQKAALYSAEDKLAVKRLDPSKLQFLQDARMKSAERTMKGPGILGSPFGTMSIIMSGIAASMFVWQQVLGIITSVVAAGNDYDQVMRKIAGSSRLSERGIEVLGGKMREMVKDGIDTKQISEGFESLRARGLSVGDSMKYLTQTTQLARYGFVKMADAAQYVATGNTGMIDYITKMNKAMEGGSQEAWNKFSGRMKDIAADFFKKQEPEFTKMLDDLSSWVDIHGKEVVQGLKDITDAMIAFGKAINFIISPKTEILESLFKTNKEAVGSTQENYLKMLEARAQKEDEKNPTREGLDLGKGIRTFMEEYRKKHDLELPSNIIIKPWETEPPTKQNLKKGPGAFDPKEKEAIAALRDTSQDPITDIAQLKSIWQQVLTKIGLVPKAMVAQSFIELNATLALMGRAGVSTPMRREFEDVTNWTMAQQEVAKQMETFKKLFETTGWTRKEYWDNEEKNIKFRMEQEVKYARLTSAEAEKEKRNELEGVRIRKEAPRVAIHEAIFADTGKMSNYLEMQKKLAIEHSRTKSDMMEEGPGKDRAQQRANERAAIQLIKLSREKYSIELADMKSFYSDAGIEQDRYRQMAMSDIEKQVDLDKAKYPKMIESLEEFGRELRRRLEDEISAPLIAKWEKYYSTIGKMSEDHYLLINDQTAREAERLKKTIGEPRADEWQKREITKTQAQYLRGQPNPFDGIIAGMKELEAESRPIANTFADEWKSAANDIHSSFKDGFFDLMTADFTKLEETINNILKRILKMVTDMTFEMMTKSLRESMSGEGAQSIIKDWGSSIGMTLGLLPGKGKEFTEPAANAYRQLDEGKLGDYITKAMSDYDGMASKAQELMPKTETIAMATVETMVVNNMVGGTGGGSGSIIESLVSKVFGTGGGGSGAAGGSADGFIAAGGMSARGNIFNQFGHVAFARGGIVGRPTLFPFARGTGLMGEAGPEAILPLSRGTGGILGVRAEGAGGGGGETSVIVHNYSGQPVQTRESNKGGMDKRVIEVMVGNAIASGGPASKAFETTYGLRRAGR